MSPEFKAAYEKAESLDLAARTATRVAQDLQYQADQQRRVVDRLFHRLVMGTTQSVAPTV